MSTRNDYIVRLIPRVGGGDDDHYDCRIKEDRRSFALYASGKKTVQEALDDFKSNNNIREDIYVGDFEEWLRSLGY